MKKKITLNKQRYKERCKSFTVTMNRRIKLAAVVKNEKIEALTVTLERRRKLVEASILNQTIELNGEAIIRDWRSELVDYGIERQKYYDEYLNECTAARKSEKADYVAATDEYNNECTAARRADYVAATATMIANTWIPNYDSYREAKENMIIDTLRNSKDDDGLGKDTADALLILWKTKQCGETTNQKREIKTQRRIYSSKRRNSPDTKCKANRNTIP